LARLDSVTSPVFVTLLLPLFVILIGRTAIGRTTIDVLRIDLPNRAAIRALLIEDGAF
jgi:hypothetical protein